MKVCIARGGCCTIILFDSSKNSINKRVTLNPLNHDNSIYAHCMSDFWIMGLLVIFKIFVECEKYVLEELILFESDKPAFATT